MCVCHCPSAVDVLIAVISPVVVSITQPVFWNALPTGTLELSHGARMDTAQLVTAVPTVVLYGEREIERKSKGE